MPTNEITAIEENPDIRPLGSEETQGSPAPDADKDKPKPIFKNFLTADAAEKGWNEVQSAKTRAEQKAAELEKRAADLEQKLALASRLERLEGQNSSPRKTPEQIKAELKKRIADDGEDGVVDFMLDTIGAQQEENARLLKQFQDTVGAQLGETRKEVEKVTLFTNPVYQTHKAKIDKLVQQHGFSYVQAVQFVSDPDLFPQSNMPPAASPTSASSSGGRARGMDTGRKQVTLDEISTLVSDLTPEEMKRHGIRSR